MTPTAELQIDFSPHGMNGSAMLTARIGDEVLEHAKVDLSKPKARKEWASLVAKDRPGIDPAAIEKTLLGIAVKLADRAKKSDEEKPSVPPSEELLHKMPQHVRDDARSMLESPDLVKRVLADVASLGVAGEKELIATIYLIGVSRLLPRPLAAIVQAPSSTGKSYTTEKVASLFPPETVIRATAMTAQSLYYLEPGALRHKWIVAGERSRREDDETAEATRALREMISSGKLTKLVPMKEGGKIATQRIEQDGPIAFIETTTLSRIFDEDDNRCLLLSADERQQQTSAIIDRLAAGYNGSGGSQSGGIIDKHFALQRMLQQREVLIPFASKVAEHFDTSRVEARRAFPNLMSMIQASTLLHQFQRQLDSEGRIVADPKDYELGYGLVKRSLSRLLGGSISDAAVRFYDRLTEWASDKFTTTEAVKKDRATKAAIAGWLRELADAGGVEQIEQSKGNRPAVWKLTGIDRKELLSAACQLPPTIA